MKWEGLDVKGDRYLWSRVTFGVILGIFFPLAQPAFGPFRWFYLFYVAHAVYHSRERRPDPLTRVLRVCLLDMVGQLIMIQRFGSLAPGLISFFLFANILYPFAHGPRRGLLMAIISVVAYDTIVVLEAAGILPYAPNALAFQYGRHPPRPGNYVAVAGTLTVMIPFATHIIGNLLTLLRDEQRKNRDLLEKLVLGNYRLERLVGHGGMGQVWKAVDLRDQRFVALKFLTPEIGAAPDARERLLREARSAAAIDHPNVVRVHDVFELDDGTPVMVMDLLVGETLQARLARTTKLSLEEAARILLPVVSAMGRAHEVRILHRDLKPDNIFITKAPIAPTGEPQTEHIYVLDFGIAKEVSEDETDPTIKLTRTGLIVGTPEYMAPEQAFGERVDHRVDVWAIGVILYRCLSGTLPFEGKSTRAVLRSLVLDEVVPLGVRAPDLPSEVLALVDGMLVRDRTRRQMDLREAYRVLTELAVAAPSPSFGPPPMVTDADTVPSEDDRATVAVTPAALGRSVDPPQ